jgi:hypothetical protein
MFHQLYIEHPTDSTSIASIFSALLKCFVKAEKLFCFPLLFVLFIVMAATVIRTNLICLSGYSTVYLLVLAALKPPEQWRFLGRYAVWLL